MQQNEVQPKSVKVLKIADYFAEYREKGDGLAAFLGASIIAKVARCLPSSLDEYDTHAHFLQITFVNDSSGKNFVSKADYSEKGPRAIIEMSPALL